MSENALSKSGAKNLLASVLKKLISNGTICNPVGTIISFMGNTAPTGYLICDGTEYNIADYSTFAEYITAQFGSVNYFGGDGETTFAVPNLTNKFLKGSTIAGTAEEAGLPNITGSFNHDWGSYTNKGTAVLGAFYYGGSISNAGSTGGGSTDGIANFDASKSNAIYGNSETVTPENISVLYCIKY